MKYILAVSLLFCVAVHAQIFANLPTNWVDNNAATDGINCGGLCTGAGYTPPAYEFLLGPSGGTWVTGPPSGCTFASLSTYTSTATGKQAAINDIEACRTYGITHGGVKDCTILDVPPVSSQVSPPPGVPAGAYWSANGITIPQTSNTPASCFNIVRSTADATLSALSEPVCAGGIQDNLPTSVHIRLINPDCAGDLLAYQSGPVVIPIPVGPFTLANGVATNTSNYNYIQYMYQDVCTSTSNCIVIQFCTVVPTSASPCAASTMGPDHWLFEDGAASQFAGGFGANEIVTTSSGSTSVTSESQLATDIHFRRYWSHGDWTDLASGSNSSTNGFNLTMCKHCSLVGSTTSQMLRPGGEGHAVLLNGTNYKIVDDVFEGQSSCIFTGGFSNTPFLGFVPARDTQIGRVLCTYPYQWLGANNTFPCNPFCGTIPNNNVHWAGASTPWIVSPTMVYISGSTLNFVSGDPFHDSVSTWPGNTITVNGTTKYKLAASGSWTQTCGGFCYPSNPPTQIPLTACTGTGCGTLPCTVNCGTIGSPITFTMVPFSLVRKNCDEKKSTIRMVIYGFICENVDQSGGQNGTVTTINIRNTSGGAQGQNYYANIQDLTVLNTIYRNACWGPELAGRSNSKGGDGGGTSMPMNRVAWVNSLIYNITGTNPGCPNTHIGFQENSGGQFWQGTVTENSAGDHATFVGTFSVDVSAPVSQSNITATSITSNVLTVTAANNFVVGENVTLRGTAESFLNGQQVAVLSGVTGSQFTATFTNANYSNASDTGTVSGPAGFETFDIIAGEPLAITKCTNSAFNVSTHSIGTNIVPVGVGAQPLNPVASTGSTPWGGTLVPGNVTVTYPWVATPNLVDSSGTCTFTNTEGPPQHMLIKHMTFVTDANQSFGNGNQPGGVGPNFQYDHVFRDSIILNSGASHAGWYNSSVGEGTPTQTFNYDANSMTADHLVWPTRTSTNYTAYGNNPSVPVASPVMYFPSLPYCTGAIPTINCVGFVGAMNTSGPMPLTLADYHGYTLRSDSVFAAGQSQQASDGTAMGANLSAIDAAQVADPFVCPSSCGSPGPFFDGSGGSPFVPPTTAPTLLPFVKLESKPDFVTEGIVGGSGK